MEHDQLKLENQLCFPIYAASRLITREYQPYLDDLGITYPQYLVLMILWEEDGKLVNDIAKKLILKTNTITPLLQRMEKQNLVSRKRSQEDERKVTVYLTEKGLALQIAASTIPHALSETIMKNSFDLEELIHLKKNLEKIISVLSK